jgi:hypothetical protein
MGAAGRPCPGDVEVAGSGRSLLDHEPAGQLPQSPGCAHSVRRRAAALTDCWVGAEVSDGGLLSPAERTPARVLSSATGEGRRTCTWSILYWLVSASSVTVTACARPWPREHGRDQAFFTETVGYSLILATSVSSLQQAWHMDVQK